MNSLRREVARQFSIAVGGDAQSQVERVPYVTRVYDALVERFTTEGWPQSDEAVVEAVRREVERYV